MISSRVAETPKIVSTRCMRRACATENGGLKVATSTASIATTVNAARWCRDASSADAFTSIPQYVGISLPYNLPTGLGVSHRSALEHARCDLRQDRRWEGVL